MLVAVFSGIYLTRKRSRRTSTELQTPGEIDHNDHPWKGLTNFSKKSPYPYETGATGGPNSIRLTGANAETCNASALPSSPEYLEWRLQKQQTRRPTVETKSNLTPKSLRLKKIFFSDHICFARHSTRIRAWLDRPDPIFPFVPDNTGLRSARTIQLQDIETSMFMRPPSHAPCGALCLSIAAEKSRNSSNPHFWPLESQ
jgi:hypothetical protein